MRKRLVVHAGANKTGSSAIQKFLSLNCEALARAGVAVPDGDLRPSLTSGGQHVFTFEQLCGEDTGRSRLESAIHALADAQPDIDTIVLSAENLAANPAAPPLFAGLLGEFDVQLLLYVRRQDDYLLSSWQQWYSKVRTDFWAWIIQEAGIMGNWNVYLKRWESVIPRDQITVRVFERERLSGHDVVADFYHWLGLPQPLEEWARPQKEVNLSVSDAVMELVKGNSNIFKNAHDSDFYNFVLDLTGDAYVKRPRQSLISFEQRLALIQRYAPGNQRVRERYLPNSKQLFTMPRETDYVHLSEDRLRIEQLQFLTDVVWGIHRRNQQRS